MAKDIRECLLEQARKFYQWQEIKMCIRDRGIGEVEHEK